MSKKKGTCSVCGNKVSAECDSDNCDKLKVDPCKTCVHVADTEGFHTGVAHGVNKPKRKITIGK